MWTKRVGIVVFFFLLVGVVYNVVTRCGVADFLDSQRHPKAVVPTLIELDPKEFGEQVIAPIEIRNCGADQLVLNEFKVSCGCAGIERLIEGAYCRVDDVRIGPNDVATLILRYPARGEPGSLLRSSVQFSTNDPEMQRVTVEIVHSIRAAITSSPEKAVFGSVHANKEYVLTLDIRNNGLNPPFVLGDVTVDKPDAVRVKIQSVSSLELICQLQVTIGPNLSSGRLDQSISLFQRGSSTPALVIPVVANVLPVVEVIPSTVILPRRVGMVLQYDGEVVCRGTRDDSIDVRVLGGMDGLLVEVRSGVDEREKLVRVRWLPSNTSNVAKVEKKYLHLIATASNKEYPLKIPVIIVRHNPE